MFDEMNKMDPSSNKQFHIQRNTVQTNSHRGTEGYGNIKSGQLLDERQAIGALL